MYKLTNTNSVIRLSDNATIPADNANTDYQSYLAWVQDGNTPQPLPQESADDIIKRLEQALDKHLDNVANSYRYESIRTMVTYVNDPDLEFQSHGAAALAFRSAVYRYGVNKIKACTREVSPEPIPTESELIAELPLFTDFLA
jgi:hypothetical protein